MKQAKIVPLCRSSTRLPLKVQFPSCANSVCSCANVSPPSTLRRNTRLDGAKSPGCPILFCPAASTVPLPVTRRLGSRQEGLALVTKDRNASLEEWRCCPGNRGTCHGNQQANPDSKPNAGSSRRTNCFHSVGKLEGLRHCKAHVQRLAVLTLPDGAGVGHYHDHCLPSRSRFARSNARSAMENGR